MLGASKQVASALAGKVQRERLKANCLHAGTNKKQACLHRKQ